MQGVEINHHIENFSISKSTKKYFLVICVEMHAGGIKKKWHSTGIEMYTSDIQ